jgi:phenylacetate-CoA ligase
MALEDLVYRYVGSYKRLPDGMKAALTLPFRVLPRSVYLGHTYRQTLRLARRLETASSDEVADHQWRQLTRLVRHCYDTVPHYSRTWRELGLEPGDLRSFDDFSRAVPFVTRDMVQAQPEAFVSDAFAPSKRLSMNTGGSTGRPLQLWYLKGHTRGAEWGHMHAYWERFGFRPGCVTANLRGEFVGAQRPWSWDPWRKLLMLSSFALSADTADGYLAQLSRHKVEFLNGYPSSLHLLTQLSGRKSAGLRSLRGIILASENVLDWQVEAIARFFGTDNVFWHYGHGEVVALGAACPAERRYHFMPSYGYVEWGPGLDDQPGSVEIVGTGFVNPLMPLVRYRTQDYGLVAAGACSCGRSHVALSRVIGRRQELAIGFENRAITLTALIFGRHAHYFHHIHQMQIVNTAPGHLVVRVVPNEQFGPADEQEIIAMLSPAQGMPFETTVEKVERVTATARGKQPFLIREFPWEDAETR